MEAVIENLKESVEVGGLNKNERLKFLDVRWLAYGKLRASANRDSVLQYRQAIVILGRNLHMKKEQSRQLLLQMAVDGFLSFNCKGKIFLHECDL